MFNNLTLHNYHATPSTHPRAVFSVSFSQFINALVNLELRLPTVRTARADRRNLSLCPQAYLPPSRPLQLSIASFTNDRLCATVARTTVAAPQVAARALCLLLSLFILHRFFLHSRTYMCVCVCVRFARIGRKFRMRVRISRAGGG